MVKIKARNVDIYVGKIADASAFDPADRGNDTSLAEYIDAEITSENITDWTKVSNNTSEINIEPAEDDTETKNYFGETSEGAQNSETFVTPNSDVDISFTADSDVMDDIQAIGLEESGVTHTTYSDYQSFNMGSTTSDALIMFVRIKRLYGSTYYFRNILLKEPVFSKVGGFGGSSDDAVLSTEYTLLGNKSKGWIDWYSHTEDESLSNL